MTFTSEAAYYLTLLEQMMICTFFYHHISRPKKSYWFTVGFYFACVAAVHIAFLPFGEASLQALLPHIILILAQFPVMIWHEDTLLRKVLLVIGNCTVQTVLESLLVMLYAAMSHTDLITFATVDSGSTQLAAGRLSGASAGNMTANTLCVMKAARRSRPLQFRSMPIPQQTLQNHNQAPK